MAYDNDVREVLASVQKNNRGERIVVSKITNNVTGTVNADIRLYYTNDDDELAPTKKGCRFNAENALDIMKGMLGLLEVDELETLQNHIAKLVDGGEDGEGAEAEDEDEDEDGDGEDLGEALGEDEEVGFMQ